MISAKEFEDQSMIETRHTKIKILGREFSIKTDGNEKYVKEIVDYVSRAAHDVMDSGSRVTTLDVMIKTAVRITEELFQIKEENRQIRGLVNEESQKLIQYIDENIQGP
jgi:cell division protein ZapA (FtsZ GTPase activity inhibitor)